MAVKELFHLADLHVGDSLSGVLLANGLEGSFEKCVGQLEGDDASSFVTNKDDGVFLVEGDVESGGLLVGRLYAHLVVFILIEIINVKLALGGDGSEHS